MTEGYFDSRLTDAALVAALGCLHRHKQEVHAIGPACEQVKQAIRAWIAEAQQNQKNAVAAE
jgi:hypothetical protein